MEIDSTRGPMLNSELFSGIIILLPFSNMYITKIKIIGNNVELQFSDNTLLDRYGIKIYYERNRGSGKTIQALANNRYTLEYIPNYLSLTLYEEETGLLVDKIDYPLYTSNRIEALTQYEYIIDLINQGESETVELKGYSNYGDICSHRDELISSVLSFSNTYGGTIIIGVKDDKTILGFKDQTPFEELKKRLVNMIDGDCEPLITFEIESIQDDAGTKLLIIKVSPGSNPPYIKKKNGIYLRIKDIDRSCSRAELEELVSRRLYKQE